MAAYILTTAIEAHALGAATPPTWYDDAVADGSIVDKGNGRDYFVCSRYDGPLKAVIGDYVKYTAQVSTPGQSDFVPKYFELIPKATFEATYSLEE